MSHRTNRGVALWSCPPLLTGDVEDDADPDTLKMPENPDHRRIVDAIGIAAARQLRPNTIVYRDMNWYPSDGGHAMAPDLMTLPAGVLERGAKSYRQRLVHMPCPGVVVEVASNRSIAAGTSPSCGVALGAELRWRRLSATAWGRSARVFLWCWALARSWRNQSRPTTS